MPQGNTGGYLCLKFRGISRRSSEAGLDMSSDHHAIFTIKVDVVLVTRPLTVRTSVSRQSWHCLQKTL